MNNTTYVENGILYFNELKDSRLKIATTYDNSIWGNMNPYFEKTVSGRESIQKKDDKIADILGYDIAYCMNAREEDSIIEFDNKTITYLNWLKRNEERTKKYVITMVNSAIIYPQDIRYGYIMAIRDCAVAVIVPKNHEFMLIIHMGANQLAIGLHHKTIRLLENRYKDIELKESTVYITPYISQRNFFLNPQKYELYKSLLGESIDKYIKEGFTNVFNNPAYYFDFISMFKDQMKDSYGITNFVDSNIDTFEATQSGFLFSYKYVQELKKRKENGEEISQEEIDKYLGCHNVIVSI